MTHRVKIENPRRILAEIVETGIHGRNMGITWAFQHSMRHDSPPESTDETAVVRRAPAPMPAALSLN